MENFKKFIVLLSMLSIFASITTACDTEPDRVRDACLTTGDPGCFSVPAQNGNCNTDPRKGQPCVGLDGRTGTYVCSPNQTALECVPGNPGPDGGTYVCLADPTLGTPCHPATGSNGVRVCQGNTMVCLCTTDCGGGTGGDGGYNCLTDPGLGSSCTPATGTSGVKVCEGNVLTCHCTANCGGGGYVCTADPKFGTPCTPATGTNGIQLCSGNTPYCQCTTDCGGGTGGDGGTGGYSCTGDPNYGKPCTPSVGTNGIQLCSGNTPYCQCTANCGGGTGGDGGTGGTGGVYTCSTDPKLNMPCAVGAGYCKRSGVNVCNSSATGVICNAVAGTPNPAGEICGNGVDDDCDGNLDETPCTSGGGTGGTDGGTGGSGGGDAGTGGGGTDGGTGGSGGGAGCTTASTSNVMVTGASSLATLFLGEGSASSSNPLNKTFANNSLLATVANGGIAITTSAGVLNFWEPYSPGGDPTPLLDTLYCRQLGITPPDPSSCNATVIGDRKSASYLAGILEDWRCWKKGLCPPTIVGHVPGDLFALRKKISSGDSLVGYSFSGTKFGVVEMPAKCP